MNDVAGQIILSAIEAMIEMLDFAVWKPQKPPLALGPARASHWRYRKRWRIRLGQSRGRKLSRE
jgi:hypothetical protein